jgi:hypothetical protein
MDILRKMMLEKKLQDLKSSRDFAAKIIEEEKPLQSQFEYDEQQALKDPVYAAGANLEKQIDYRINPRIGNVERDLERETPENSHYKYKKLIQKLQGK